MHTYQELSSTQHSLVPLSPLRSVVLCKNTGLRDQNPHRPMKGGDGQQQLMVNFEPQFHFGSTPESHQCWVGKMRLKGHCIIPSVMHNYLFFFVTAQIHLLVLYTLQSAKIYFVQITGIRNYTVSSIALACVVSILVSTFRHGDMHSHSIIHIPLAFPKRQSIICHNTTRQMY